MASPMPARKPSFSKLPSLPSVFKRTSSKKDATADKADKKAVPMSAEATVDSQLIQAEQAQEQALAEIALAHLNNEQQAAETVDKIQTEVKVEREKRYSLERRASQENVLNEQKKQQEAAVRAAEVKAVAERKQKLMMLAASLACLLLLGYMLFSSVFAAGDAPASIAEPAAQRTLCVGKLCVPGKVPTIKLPAIKLSAIKLPAIKLPQLGKPIQQ